MGTKVERRPVLFKGDIDVRGDEVVAGDEDVAGQSTTGTSVSGGVGETLAGAITPETGVVATFQNKAALQHVRLTVSGLVIAITAALDYGSELLGTLPDKNIRLVSVEADLTLTKDGSEIVAATDLAAAIGSAAASNTTLTGAMADMLSSQALTDDVDPAILQAFEFADLDIVDAAANEIYLNVSSADISGDGDVTANGTIDLYFFDLGNVTS